MNLLGMFAKHWQPGCVKTRLAASLGPIAAGRTYRQFLLVSLQRFRASGQRRVLFYTPRDKRAAFCGLVESAAVGHTGWDLSPQGVGDLGARMRRQLSRAVARGARRIVLIGSDSPNLPKERIAEAFERLSAHRVVLGPSDDGGYYLLGMRPPFPELFAGVSWGSEHVLSGDDGFTRVAEVRLCTAGPLVRCRRYRWTCGRTAGRIDIQCHRGATAIVDGRRFGVGTRSSLVRDSRLQSPEADDSNASTSQSEVLRVMDANGNRSAEGLRVVEEFARFVLSDSHLAGRCKQLRHETPGGSTGAGARRGQGSRHVT